MGYVNNDEDPLWKSVRGRLGAFTVYERLGRICVRQRPVGFKPSGEGQVAQQRRIASVNILYQAVNAAGFAAFWKQAVKPKGWCGYNLFVSKNLPAFDREGLIGDAGKIWLTPESGLQLPDEMKLSRDEDGAWVLTWKNVTYYPCGKPADRVMVALMQGSDRFDVKMLDEAGVAHREDEKARFVIPAKFENYGHLYCFMRSETGTSVSASKYFLL